ncbi:MAG: hypothetical protein K6U87_10380 [Firmicutes bacterium]|nr:hypothetical protein [Bacillota bacterium]
MREGRFLEAIQAKVHNPLFPWGAEAKSILEQRYAPVGKLTEFEEPTVFRNRILWWTNHRENISSKFVEEFSRWGVANETNWHGAWVLWFEEPFEPADHFGAWLSGWSDLEHNEAWAWYFDAVVPTRWGPRHLWRPPFSPALAEAAHYFGPVMLVRGDVWNSLIQAGITSLEQASQVLMEQACCFQKGPGVPVRLYHLERPWRKRETGFSPTELELNPISIIVPSRNPSLIASFLDSLIRTSRRNIADLIKVVVIANGPQAHQVISAAEHRWPRERLESVLYEGAFNWSTANRLGAAKAWKKGWWVFANDDIEWLDDKWPAHLNHYLTQGSVGAIGACLLYPNGDVQHAGIASPKPGVWVHRFQFLPDGIGGYMGLLQLPQDVAAVTGALVATRPEVYHATGGFKEGYPLAYNDIDYCLRLGQGLLRTVYVPEWKAFHRETATRQRTSEPPSTRLFEREWGGYQDRWFPRDLSRWYGFPAVREIDLDI